MKLLRAVGAAVTAFVDELSPYDFPLFADIPEEQPVLRWGAEDAAPVGFNAMLAEDWDSDEDAVYDDDYTPRPRNYSKCSKCGNDLVLTHHCDSSCAEAAVEEVPGAVQLPEATAPGQPEPELIAAASIGLREWADGAQCDLPLYWAWIARELAPK